MAGCGHGHYPLGPSDVIAVTPDTAPAAGAILGSGYALLMLRLETKNTTREDNA